jgi:hypothetical protein
MVHKAVTGPLAKPMLNIRSRAANHSVGKSSQSRVYQATTNQATSGNLIWVDKICCNGPL